LPFIQFGKNSEDFEIVPILQKDQDQLTSEKLAKLLTSVLPREQKIVLLSTSNLTHYLNYDECYNADKLIISEILKLDVDSFYKILDKYSRLVCGFGCIATAMKFSRIMGNSDAILLNQSNSGDIDGNKSSVVGYTSIMMV
jgi:AmmeMemoRadiSam system protein B